MDCAITLQRLYCFFVIEVGSRSAATEAGLATAAANNPPAASGACTPSPTAPGGLASEDLRTNAQ